MSRAEGAAKHFEGVRSFGRSPLLSEREQLLWVERAKALLHEALRELEEDFDAIPTISAAEACLRVECGELDPSELDGYPFPGEPDDRFTCICPADLLERGGFKGACPVHRMGGS